MNLTHKLQEFDSKNKHLSKRELADNVTLYLGNAKEF
jgi:hypothetical protein